MAKKLIVFGGSGHAKDVIAVARLLDYDRFEAVTTDGSCQLPGLRAVREVDFHPPDYAKWDAIIAIGDNRHRRRFFEQYAETVRFVSIISPEASVSRSARIGRCCYLGAFAYLGPDAEIGDGCIVNTHAVVGHDARIGDFSHVSPRVCLSGHVEIGKNVFVGAGANFNNGSYQSPLTVADEVYIGMGCQVTESIRHPGVRLIPKPNYIVAPA